MIIWKARSSRIFQREWMWPFSRGATIRNLTYTRMTRHHHSNHCPVGVPNCCSINPAGFSTALGFLLDFSSIYIDCDLKSVGSKFTTKNFTLTSHAWCSIITTITAKRMRFLSPFFSIFFWSSNFCSRVKLENIIRKVHCQIPYQSQSSQECAAATIAAAPRRPSCAASHFARRPWHGPVASRRLWTVSSRSARPASAPKTTKAAETEENASEWREVNPESRIHRNLRRYYDKSIKTRVARRLLVFRWNVRIRPRPRWTAAARRSGHSNCHRRSSRVWF